MKTANQRQNSLCNILIMTALLGALSLVWASQARANDTLTTSVQGEGRDIVLIPGLMSDASVWQNTKDLLAEDYRVHTLSIAGFGEVPAIPELQQDFLTPITKAIHHYLAEHTNDPIIVGHSLGGTLTYKFAIDHPQSLSCGVAVDGVPFLPALMMYDPQTTVAKVKPQAQQMRAAFNHFTAAQLRQQAQQGVAIQATAHSDQQRVLALAEQSDPQTAGQALYELMVTDLRDEVAELKTPMLQMAATGGFTERVQQQQALKLYEQQIAGNTNIQLVEFADARHFIMWDQPQTFTQTLTQFIQDACHE